MSLRSRFVRQAIRPFVWVDRKIRPVTDRIPDAVRSVSAKVAAVALWPFVKVDRLRRRVM